MIAAPSLKPARLFVGVDPGFSGAIGAVDQECRFRGLWDMPTRGGEGRTREIDAAALVLMARHIVQTAHAAEVYLEWPQTRPNEAPEASKRFGVGLGNLEAAFLAAGATVHRVAPNLWKGQLGLEGKDRDATEARNAAVRMAEDFVRPPAGALRGPRGGALDGRAEALLIAWWAATRTREGLAALDEDTRLARLLMGGRRRRRGGGTPI